MAATIVAAGCTARGNAVFSTIPDATPLPAVSAAAATSPALASAVPATSRCPMSEGALYATLDDRYVAKAPIDPTSGKATVGEAGDAEVLAAGSTSEVKFATAGQSELEDVSPRSVEATLSEGGKIERIAASLRGAAASVTLPIVAGNATFLILDVALANGSCADVLVRLAFRLRVGDPPPSPSPDCASPDQQFAATLHGIYGDAWQAIAPITVAGTGVAPTEPGTAGPIPGFAAPRFYAVDLGLVDDRPGVTPVPLTLLNVAATLTASDGERPLNVRLQGATAILRLPAVTGPATITMDVRVRFPLCRNGTARMAWPIQIVDVATVGACAPGDGPATVEVPRPASLDMRFGDDPAGIWTVSESARFGYWSHGDMVWALAGFADIGPATAETAGSHVAIRSVDPSVALSIGGFGAQAFHWAAIHNPAGDVIDGDPAPVALRITTGPGGSLDLKLPTTPGGYGLMVNLGWSAPCIEGAGYLFRRVEVR